jgi:hypothetical protein
LKVRLQPADSSQDCFPISDFAGRRRPSKLLVRDTQKGWVEPPARQLDGKELKPCGLGQFLVESLASPATSVDRGDHGPDQERRAQRAGGEAPCGGGTEAQARPRASGAWPVAVPTDATAVLEAAHLARRPELYLQVCLAKGTGQSPVPPSGGSVDAGRCSESPGRHDRLHIPGGQGPASNDPPGQRQATAHSPQAGMPVPRGRPWACPSNYATLPDCVRSRSTNSAKSDRHWLRSVGHHAMNFIVLIRPSSWCW